jgi:hypothetical protein
MQAKDWIQLILSMTVMKAKLSNSCIICGKAVIAFRNRLAELEYKCSGLCQLCQNFYFN